MSTPKFFFDFGDFNIEDFSPVTITEIKKPFEELTNKQIEEEIIRIRLDIKKEQEWQESLNINDYDRLRTMAEIYGEIKEYYQTINEKYKEHINSKNYRPILSLGGKVW